MKTIAFDISPLNTGHQLRGVGFYTRKLSEFFKNYQRELTDRSLKLIVFNNQKVPKEADLVHYPYFDPFFLTLPIFKKKKTLVTIHDLIPLIFPDKYLRGVRGEIKWQIQKFALSNTSGIITDSKNSQKDIIKIIGYPKDKIYPISLAPDEIYRKLEDGNWKFESRSKYNLPENFILYVGDVNYNKNVVGLIKAFKNVKSKTKILNLKLVLIGGAFLNKELSETKEINNLIDNFDLKKDIIMPGQITDGNLVMFYNLASLYIQPSFYEGFGLPVLEAMACGCPIVCSKTSSLPEVGGKAVFYIKPENNDNMVKGMIKVLTDDLLRNKLLEEGKSQIKKFSWEKTGNETLNVYKKLLQ